MELPISILNSRIFQIVSFVLVLFIAGWMLSKVAHGAKSLRASRLGAKAGRRARDSSAKPSGKGPYRTALIEEQKHEQKIDKVLGVAGKHLTQHSKFESQLINAKKKLWIGKDGERVHSKKALLTAKRLADVMDDQAMLWKTVSKAGIDSGTRFHHNQEDIEKLMVRLRLYLLELAREIQQEVESERGLIDESQKAEELQRREATGTRKSMMIAEKAGMESRIPHAGKEEIHDLKRELKIEYEKFHDYNTLVQAGVRMTGLNRFVYAKIREILTALMTFKAFLEQNKFKGGFGNNAPQQAHNLVVYCKKLDENVATKAVAAKTIGKLTGGLGKLGKKKRKLTEEAISVVNA